VIGIDVDTQLGARSQATLHEAGHTQCRSVSHDITSEVAIPAGPYNLVYARLLLFHLPARMTVLRRLWEAVAPGGHLVVQDYDLRTISTTPALDSIEQGTRVVNAAFTAAGCDIHTGTRLSDMFLMAGVGAPDGTDVAGRVEPLAGARVMLEAVYRNLLPVSLAHGIVTQSQAETDLARLADDSVRHASRPTLWPLMGAAWKRKP
jgi:hypothetical protein